ncbi:CD163 molecule, partial [Homo sapiens]
DDAQVVCQQLGCGPALKAFKEAEFGQGTGPIWLNEVKCKGNESSLWDCPARRWGHSECGHKEDAAVNCTDISVQKTPQKATTENSHESADFSAAELISVSKFLPISGMEKEAILSHTEKENGNL